MGFGFSTSINLGGRSILGFGGSLVVLNPAQIFGTDLYDWWDYTDLATQSITGGLIDSITSKGTNAAVFAASGTERPASIVGVNSLNVADFDGVNDFMQVAGSTGMYKFLHNGSLGTVIIITKATGNQSVLLNKSFSTRPGIRMISPYDNWIGNESLRVALAGNSADYSDGDVNVSIHKIDAGNPTLADRILISNNFGSFDGNNIESGIPYGGNSQYNMTIGGQPLIPSFGNIEIMEVVLLKDIHPTPTQITQLNAYLTNKYGSPFPII